MHDLDEIMAGDDTLIPPDVYDAADQTQHRPPLAVQGRGHANRALRRLGILAAQEAEIRADYDEQRAQLDGWLADRMHAIETHRDWLVAGLEGWARAVNAEDPETVTVKLAAGEVRLRTAPPRLEVTDSAAAVAGGVPVRAPKPPEIDAAATKKLTKPSGARVLVPAVDEVPVGYHVESAVTETGEVLAGVVYLVPDQRRFEWSPAKAPAKDQARPEELVEVNGHGEVVSRYPG